MQIFSLHSYIARGNSFVKVSEFLHNDADRDQNTNSFFYRSADNVGEVKESGMLIYICKR